MYGEHVHRAVIESGDTVSGCTVHLVTAEVDSGDILGRTEVPVHPGENPVLLARRVLTEEHRLYPRVIQEYAETLSPGF